MRKKKIILISILLAIAVTFTWSVCFKINIKKHIPGYVSSDIMNSRSQMKKDMDTKKNIYEKSSYTYKDFSDELKPGQIKFNNNKPADNITHKQAFDDIDYMFRILKYGYAGYGYFGGDAKFTEARKNIETAINKSSEIIPLNSYYLILYNNLKFIQDGHFRIGNLAICARWTYFYSEKYSFQKDSSGYFTMIDNKKYYITEADGGKPEKYIKISLDQEGNIVNYLGTLINTMEYQYDVKPISIKLKYKNDIRDITVYLNKVIGKDMTNEPEYSYYEKAGIPVVQCRAMYSKNGDEKLINEFTDSAGKLKDKMFIMDLRGNPGGSTEYPRKWYVNYTGNYIDPCLLLGDLVTYTTLANMEYSLQSSVYYDEKTKEYKINKIKSMKESADFKEGFTFYKPAVSFIKNKKLIVVITDKDTASSAEEFLSYLETMSNVIVVGTNTCGCDLILNNLTYSLPGSNITLTCGSSLNNMTAREGTGFLPDFWVGPNNAIDRVISFLKKYDTDID